MMTFSVVVVGVTFEGRQEVIKLLSGKEPCRLVPEPDNKYDKNAIAVHVAAGGKIHHVGFIPKQYAAKIAPHMEGESFDCKSFFVTGGFEMANGSVANYGLVVLVDLPDDTFPRDELPF